MTASDIHFFFVYVFFGSLFSFSLVLLSLKIFNIQNPKQRMSLYLLALLAPLAGFALYHTVLQTRCQSAAAVNDNLFWRIFDSLCLLGNLALRYLWPLMVLAAFLGILKGFAGKTYLKRQRGRSVGPKGEQGEWVREIFAKRCQEWHLPIPEVIFTDNPGFSAFISGFVRPVVVVSAPILEELTRQDVEAILIHELLHIRRGDAVKGWLFQLLRSIMIFSPVNAVLMNGYMMERERLCDAETAAILGTSHGYASTLVKVWRLILDSRQYRPGLSVGFSGRKKDLEQRVLRLLEDKAGGREMPKAWFLALRITVLSLTVLFLGLVC